METPPRPCLVGVLSSSLISLLALTALLLNRRSKPVLTSLAAPGTSEPLLREVEMGIREEDSVDVEDALLPRPDTRMVGECSSAVI